MTSTEMIRLKIKRKTGVIIGVSYVWCKTRFLEAKVRVKMFKHGFTRAYGGSEFEDLRILKFYSRWSFVVSLNSLSVLLPFPGNNKKCRLDILSTGLIKVGSSSCIQSHY